MRLCLLRGVTRHLQGILPLFDLVVGTVEEFEIAGGQQDLIATLRAVREVTKATLVVKRGVLGCSVIEGEIPASIDEAPTLPAFRSKCSMCSAPATPSVRFSERMASRQGLRRMRCPRQRQRGPGRLQAWLRLAMPTAVELDYFLKKAAEEPERVRRPDRDPTLAHLHRVTVPRPRWEELYIFAFDHRSQFADLARKAGCGATNSKAQGIARASCRFGRAGQARVCGQAGILADETYGQDALNAATGRGWWIGRPVELPGSNLLKFEHGRSIGTNLISWPNEHVAKCLVFYHPDDPAEHRLEQEAQVRAL